MWQAGSCLTKPCILALSVFSTAYYRTVFQNEGSIVKNDPRLGFEIFHGCVLNLQVGTEAAFHGVEEYMKYVEEYYQELEVRQGYPVETKRVYVATDEPKV